MASIDDYGGVVVSTACVADQREVAAGAITQEGMVEPSLACIAAQETACGGGNFFTSHMLSKRVSLLSASSCRFFQIPDCETKLKTSNVELVWQPPPPASPTRSPSKHGKTTPIAFSLA